MNKQNEINLSFLKNIKNDKIHHVGRLNERINELNRLKNILLKDIENIEADIAEIEQNLKEIKE